VGGISQQGTPLVQLCDDTKHQGPSLKVESRGTRTQVADRPNEKFRRTLSEAADVDEEESASAPYMSDYFRLVERL